MINRKGFTLIELLVVIAIIGLLLTLAVIALHSARTKTRDAIRLTDLREIQSRLELYFTDKNSYPATTESVVLGRGNAVCLNAEGLKPTGCANPYMSQIPADPGAYLYEYSSEDGLTYTIMATLEGAMNGLTAGKIRITPSDVTNSKQ